MELQTVALENWKVRRISRACLAEFSSMLRRSIGYFLHDMQVYIQQGIYLEKRVSSKTSARRVRCARLIKALHGTHCALFLLLIVLFIP